MWREAFHGLLTVEAGPDTNGSQFFITTAAAHHLDGLASKEMLIDLCHCLFDITISIYFKRDFFVLFNVHLVSYVIVISPNMESFAIWTCQNAPQLLGNIWMDQGKHVVFGEVLEGLEASWSFNPWKLGAFFGTNYPQKTPGKITRFTFGRFLTLAVFGHILKSKSRSGLVWISTWESNDSVALKRWSSCQSSWFFWDTFWTSYSRSKDYGVRSLCCKSMQKLCFCSTEICRFRFALCSTDRLFLVLYDPLSPYFILCFDLVDLDGSHAW